MIQGTTPTHVFRLPIDTSTIQKLRITYSQFGKTVLEATEADCTMSEKEIRFKLTQQDTLQFTPLTAVDLQIKVLTIDNNVMASKILSLSVEKILNSEVLT